MSDNYTPIIGLEIHAELSTASKMFCACANDPFAAAEPNSYTCPVCLGMPGALPIPNKKAIEWTVQLGLAVGCQINLFSKFDRKNYFYPDLAKGYQISQYDLPFCYGGKLNTTEGTIGITRIHLEEDTGKLIHDEIDGEQVSLIDFNRSGVPLVEIVSEPDIKSASQAKEYSKKLRDIMRFLGIGECKMAEGGMRLEANISLQAQDVKELPNYKVEVKNINSFKFLEQAIKYEIKRQSQLLDEGQTPVQETRGWDAATGKTFSQRTKEDAADYRYFPDPDIPPIEFSQEQIDELAANLPELPDQVAERWQSEYQLSEHNALSLVTNPYQVKMFEAAFSTLKDQDNEPNQLANDLVNKKMEFNPQNTPPVQAANLLLEAFRQAHHTQETDSDELTRAIQTILAQNTEAVTKYQAGKTQVLGFLMGQVMSLLTGKPDPAQIKSALEKALQA